MRRKYVAFIYFHTCCIIWFEFSCISSWIFNRINNKLFATNFNLIENYQLKTFGLKQKVKCLRITNDFRIRKKYKKKQWVESKDFSSLGPNEWVVSFIEYIGYKRKPRFFHSLVNRLCRRKFVHLSIVKQMA